MARIRKDASAAPDGEIIKKYRTALGLSQQELGERMGTTRNTVVNWENGRTYPDIGTLRRLCEEIGMPVQEYLGLPPGQKLMHRENILIGIYRELSETGKKLVHGVAETLLREETEAMDSFLKTGFHIVAAYPSAAAAGQGNPFSDDNIPSCLFVRNSARSDPADAVIPVSGRSMEPEFYDGDRVFVKFTDHAEDGNIVICVSADGAVIKKKMGNKLYSLNPDFPYGEKGDDDNIHLVGVVTGIVRNEDLPSDSERDRLLELFSDEISRFDRQAQA